MNLTVRQLEILVALADTLNMTEAAERLGISQPAVSETLKRAEIELRLRIFTRTTRSIILTNDGMRIVASAREAVRGLNYMLSTIHHREDGPVGRVTVAALPSVVCAFLPKVIAATRARYPGIEIAVRDAPQAAAIQLLEEGVVDLALISRPPMSTKMAHTAILSDRMYAVVPRDHELSRRKLVAWKEFASHDFIALAHASSVRQLTDAGFVHCELSVSPRYEVDQIPSAAALVREGLGVTAFPELTFSMFDPAGISLVPLVQPIITRGIVLARMKNRADSAAAAIVVGLIDELRAARDSH